MKDSTFALIVISLPLLAAWWFLPQYWWASCGGLVVLAFWFFYAMYVGGREYEKGVIKDALKEYGSPVPEKPAFEEPPMKFCPSCGERYPDDYKVCPRDGSELKSIGIEGAGP